MAELRGRANLERQAAERLGRLSAKNRDELRRLLGDPPDANRVPAEFWERVRREREEELTLLLLLIFLTSAEQHGWPQDAATVAAQQWSATRAAEVSTGYVATSREMLAGGSDVATVFSPERDESIAITETTHAASAGGEAAIKATVGVSAQDRWITEADAKVCPICRPLHRTMRDTWSRFFPSGPPGHPRCRCWLEYANVK